MKGPDFVLSQGTYSFVKVAILDGPLCGAAKPRNVTTRTMFIGSEPKQRMFCPSSMSTGCRQPLQASACTRDTGTRLLFRTYQRDDCQTLRCQVRRFPNSRK